MNECNKNILCPIPWMSQSLRANGDIRVCCQAQHGPTGGILKDEDGNIYNARNADLKETRNSPLSKEIRKYMMEGKWHPECKRCQTEDEAGMRSRQFYENEVWIDHGPLTWAELLKHTKEDGTIDTDEIDCSFYDVRFGNLCNLKCRMCGPTDSNQWYDELVEMWGKEFFYDSHGKVDLIKNNKGRYVPKQDVYDWHESPHYWSQMNSNIKEIKKLYIVGGEPLMIDKHYEFLQKCIDQDCAKNIVVEYNTNLTNVPQRAWDIWKHFKQINLGVSIDGYGQRNDYMRYPSKFDKIHENLKKISTAEGNFKAWIAATVNIFNALHFPEFIEWIIKNKMPRVNDDDWIRPIISPHPLHKPFYYNTRVLPKEAKDIVHSKYETYKPYLCSLVDKQNWNDTRKENSKKDIIGLLDQYSKYMYAEDLSEHMPKFWENTRKLDSIRGTRLEDAIPELYGLIQHTQK